MSSPILRDVVFRYEDSEILDHSLTSTNFHTYYQGSEMVVAGRLPKPLSTSRTTSPSSEQRIIEYTIMATQAEGAQYAVEGAYNGSAVSE